MTKIYEDYNLVVSVKEGTIEVQSKCSQRVSVGITPHNNELLVRADWRFRMQQDAKNPQLVTVDYHD